MNLFNLFKPKPKKVSREVQVNIRETWQQVKQLEQLGGPSQLRQAVIKADTVVGAALKSRVRGETMGECLKRARDLFADYHVYQDIWDAHKVRNALVHDPSFEPTHTVLRTALRKFERGLKVLGFKT